MGPLKLRVIGRTTPKTEICTPMALDSVSGVYLLCHIDHFSNRIRSRGFRGPPCAPEGRNSTENPGA